MDPDARLLARQGGELAGRGRAKVAQRMSRIAIWYVFLLPLFWEDESIQVDDAEQLGKDVL